MKERVLALICVCLFAAGCFCSCRNYNVNSGVDPATDTISTDAPATPGDASDTLAPEEDTLFETFAPGAEVETVPNESDGFVADCSTHYTR